MTLGVKYNSPKGKVHTSEGIPDCYHVFLDQKAADYWCKKREDLIPIKLQFFDVIASWVQVIDVKKFKLIGAKEIILLNEVGII